MHDVAQKLRRGNAGMSLIEVTFASGILAMALSMLFGSLITITVVARLNEDRAVANTHLASVLEGVRTMTLDELKAFEAPVLEHPGVQRAVSLVCYDINGDEVPLPVTDPDEEMPDLPNPLEVKATLLWKNEKGHMFQSSATISVAR